MLNIESEVPSERPPQYFVNEHLPSQSGNPGEMPPPFLKPIQNQRFRVITLDPHCSGITLRCDVRCRKLHFRRNPSLRSFSFLRSSFIQN